MIDTLLNQSELRLKKGGDFFVGYVLLYFAQTRRLSRHSILEKVNVGKGAYGNYG